MIRDVNRNAWTVTAVTVHTSKELSDVQVMSPYLHYSNGEGIYHMPEPDAACMIAFPSDNSAPFIMGYIGVAGGVHSEDDQPARPGTDLGGGSEQEVTFRSRRPDLNPGDICLATRDENFVFLRRGGILQIGATDLAQRIYIPLQNYIKDFCENYALRTIGSSFTQEVERPETSSTGRPAVRSRYLIDQYATDAAASVEVSYFGDDDTAVKIVVAPSAIDRDEGSQIVASEVYSFRVDISGEVTQVSGAIKQTVNGDWDLEVIGSRSTTITVTDSLEAQTIEYLAKGEATFGASVKTKLGGSNATSPVALADQLLALFQQPDVFMIQPGAAAATGGPVTGFVALNPGKVAAFQGTVQSKKVFSE